MAKNIEDIIREFKLTKEDIDIINSNMHKDKDHLKIASQEGESYSNNYTSLFEKYTIKYINSKKTNG